MIVQYGGMLFIFDIFGVVLCCVLSTERSFTKGEIYQELLCQMRAGITTFNGVRGLQAFVGTSSNHMRALSIASELLHKILTQQRLAIDSIYGGGM